MNQRKNTNNQRSINNDRSKNISQCKRIMLISHSFIRKEQFRQASPQRNNQHPNNKSRNLNLFCEQYPKFNSIIRTCQKHPQANHQNQKIPEWMQMSMLNFFYFMMPIFIHQKKQKQTTQNQEPALNPGDVAIPSQGNRQQQQHHIKKMPL